MASTKNEYVGSLYTLRDRIVALGPQILDIDNAWTLFKVPGFKCDDLAPTLAQADAALAAAKVIVRAGG